MYQLYKVHPAKCKNDKKYTTKKNILPLSYFKHRHESLDKFKYSNKPKIITGKPLSGINSGGINMEEKETNWFDSPEYESKNNQEEKVRLPKFNITLNKGEIARTEEIIFISNGIEVNNQYGKSIMFNINYKGADMVWFIKAKSYSLLRPIKQHIPIEGKKAFVTRAGTNQTDTRWAINFPSDKQ